MSEVQHSTFLRQRLPKLLGVIGVGIDEAGIVGAFVFIGQLVAMCDTH